MTRQHKLANLPRIANLRPALAAAVLAAALAVSSSRAADPPKPAAKPGQSREINEDGSSARKLEKAPAAPEAPGPKTLALLKALEDRHGASESIEGTFKQTKTSEVFMEKIESTGKFKFRRPDLFRADYDAPDRMTNIIQKDAIYIYVPELKQAERYKFRSSEERDAQLHVMTLGLGFKATDITREYRVCSSEDDEKLLAELKAGGHDPAKVALLFAEPRKNDSDATPFNRIKLWIDKEALRPQKIWTKDYNQDQTEINILNVRFDAGLDKSVFEAKFPPGTEIIDKADQS